MVLRMKNFNIQRVHRKIRLLVGRTHEKPIERRDCLKRGGLGQFADLRGELDKKEGEGVFERGGVDTPMHTMREEIQKSIIWCITFENEIYILFAEYLDSFSNEGRQSSQDLRVSKYCYRYVLFVLIECFNQGRGTNGESVNLLEFNRKV